MDSFLSYIESEWAVVSGAPVSLLVISAFIWAGVWWVHRERIKHLKELNELKDAKIQDFQEKTNSGTPDDAKAKLEALEKKLDEVAYSAATARFS
jgi:hypothetical protein